MATAIHTISSLKAQGYKFAKVTGRMAKEYTIVRMTDVKGDTFELLASPSAMADFNNSEISQGERGWFIDAPATTEEL